jgi:protein-disulfide isomerase
MKDNKILGVIIVLVAIAAFLGGATFIRWQSQRQGAPSLMGETTPSPAAQQPEEPPGVLIAEDLRKIESGGAAVKGEEGAAVTIVEFSEYECPFCKRYVDETYPQILEEYGDKIRYIFHDYPLPFHPHAQKMAEVARCAGEQEKYWEMHDLLFAERNVWANLQDASAEITSYAEQLKLDMDEFDSCLSSGKFTQAVKDDLALGQAVGVQGTPTFFINGQRLVGAQPFGAFKAIIDAELGE